MKRFFYGLLITLSLLAIFTISVYAESVCTGHSYKIETVRATTVKAGYSQEVCENCGHVRVSIPISRISDVSLEKKSYVYDGKVKKPNVTVKDTRGRILTEGIDYSVSYDTGRKVCGKYKVVVKFQGSYKGQKTVVFRILPEKTQIDSATTKSNKSVKLTWNQAKSGVTGYKIQYSTTSTFTTKTTTTKTVKGYKNVSKTLSDLKKNKTYYFRIRTYNTYKGTTTYSAWSDVEKVYLSRSGYSVKQLLNAEKLSPQKTNHKALDDLVAKIFKKIHKPGMTTEQKVKACFNYLAKNMTYGNGYVSSYEGVYTTFYDERMVNNAYQILTTKTGVCDHYSAAFMVMCRRIGLEAYEINGAVSSKSGGYTGHAWTYIVLNGTKYIFDPQVQSRNPSAPYFFYGKTYSQMGSRYLPDGNYYNPNTFNNFKRNFPFTELKKDMTCKLKGYGNCPIISLTAQQNGKSVSRYMNRPIVTYHNNFAKLNINISGGSGKYDVFLFYSDTQEIAYTRTCTGPLNCYIDLNSPKLSSRTYDLVIYDHNDYRSYIAVGSINFLKNST